MIQHVETLTDTEARAIIEHLCSDECHGVGQTVELCESRGDCVLVVNCGGCGKQYILDEDQYEALVVWSEAHGESLACGIARLA